MAQYRKKPVAIEAIQFDGLNPTEIKDFVGENCEVEIYDNGVTPPVARIVIHTLEGDMEVSSGDYVIKGVKGEFYPCKPDIFEQTYESAETQQEQPDEVLIPRWCLENIENTLRIQHNINNDAKDGETCQDRNIKESLNCVRKLLNGEKITGRERSEPLMKQPEVTNEMERKLGRLSDRLGMYRENPKLEPVAANNDYYYGG